MKPGPWKARLWCLAAPTVAIPPWMWLPALLESTRLLMETALPLNSWVAVAKFLSLLKYSLFPYEMESLAHLMGMLRGCLI